MLKPTLDPNPNSNPNLNPLEKAFDLVGTNKMPPVGSICVSLLFLWVLLVPTCIVKPVHTTDKDTLMSACSSASQASGEGLHGSDKGVYVHRLQWLQEGGHDPVGHDAATQEFLFMPCW